MYQGLLVAGSVAMIGAKRLRRPRRRYKPSTNPSMPMLRLPTQRHSSTIPRKIPETQSSFSRQHRWRKRSRERIVPSSRFRESQLKPQQVRLALRSAVQAQPSEACSSSNTWVRIWLPSHSALVREERARRWHSLSISLLRMNDRRVRWPRNE